MITKGDNIINIYSGNRKRIVKHKYLTQDFIEKYYNKFDIRELIYHQQLGDDMVITHNISPKLLRNFENISYEFILKNVDKINWARVSRTVNLTDKLIDKFYDKLNWLVVTERKKRNIPFMIKYNKYIVWKFARFRAPLSFILKFKDKFDWTYSYNDIPEYIIPLLPFDDNYNYFVLTKQTLKKYKDRINNWTKIVQFKRQLSEAFIDEIFDKIHWNNMHHCYRNFSDEFIIKHHDKDFLTVLSRSDKLSVDLADKFFDEIDRRKFSKQKINDAFAYKNVSVLGWSMISSMTGLSEIFMDKYFDKLDWRYISKKQKISTPFIEKYCDLLEWNRIGNNWDISQDCIEKNFDRINFNKIFMESSYVMIFKKLSITFINKNINKLSNIDKFWKYISYNETINEEFIDEYIGRIDFDKLILRRKLSEKFISKHLDHVSNMPHVYKYQNLSESFIFNNVTKKDVSMILKYQCVSRDFINDNQCKSMIKYLKKNKKIKRTYDFCVGIRLPMILQDELENKIYKHSFNDIKIILQSY